MGYEDNIGTMIQHIANGDSADAEGVFNDIMMGKVTDALDVKKREVAANFFGGSADTDFAPAEETTEE